MKREELEKLKSYGRFKEFGLQDYGGEITSWGRISDIIDRAINVGLKLGIRYGFEKGREGIDSVTDPKYVNSEEVIKELDKEQDDKR